MGRGPSLPQVRPPSLLAAPRRPRGTSVAHRPRRDAFPRRALVPARAPSVPRLTPARVSSPARYRDLEHFKHDLRDVRYGGSDAGRSSGPSGKVRELPSPVTYRATLPANYDATREEPYPMLIVVPADPGYGDGLGQVGGTVAITETGFHDANGAIVLELGFNRPTWLNDAAECNHESYLLDVVLPRVLASHNVGRISLIGYANGGFGALNALFRHPHLFHRVAVCDVPVLGDFSGFARPWGVEEWNPSGDRDVDARHWWHFLDAFPHNAMFAPYNAGTLATCEYVREEIGKSAPGSPRVGLWAGSRAAWEMGELREQFEAFGVPHEWSEAWSEQPGSWSGDWLREALDFIARDM